MDFPSGREGVNGKRAIVILDVREGSGAHEVSLPAIGDTHAKKVRGEQNQHQHLPVLSMQGRLPQPKLGLLWRNGLD
jgi:hypothetical protein